MLRKLITSLKKQDVFDETDASARDISVSLLGNDASQNNRIPEKLAKAIVLGELLNSLKKQLMCLRRKEKTHCLIPLGGC